MALVFLGIDSKPLVARVPLAATRRERPTGAVDELGASRLAPRGSGDLAGELRCRRQHVVFEATL
eukprot:5790591-Heterocapsa_arctica.AAC.1